MNKRTIYKNLRFILLVWMMAFFVPTLPVVADNITFADANVKKICVQNWDTNGDGELSKDEAAAVTNIGTVFSGTAIQSFDEFQYFTGLKTIGEKAFWDCRSLASITIPTSVTSIDSNAFSKCSGLTSIKVESGNIFFDSRNNCNAIIETGTNRLVVGCKNTVLNVWQIKITFPNIVCAGKCKTRKNH